MTVNLTLRATKGAALTHDEVDANFTSLKTNIEANYLAFPTFKPQAGRYSQNSINGTSLSNGATFSANGMYLVPWFAPWDMVIDQIGINCTIAVASALCKIVVYGVDVDGLPSGAPLFEGGDLDLSTTGYKSSAVSPSLTFAKGTKFWLAVRSSSTATISANQTYCSPTIDAGTTPVTTVPAKVMRRLAVTYANPAPAWVFSASEILQAGAAYTFWMREV